MCCASHHVLLLCVALTGQFLVVTASLVGPSKDFLGILRCLLQQDSAGQIHCWHAVICVKALEIIPRISDFCMCPGVSFLKIISGEIYQSNDTLVRFMAYLCLIVLCRNRRKFHYCRLRVKRIRMATVMQ